MSVDTRTLSQNIIIVNSVTALRYSKQYNEKLKREDDIFEKLPTTVGKVDDSFYIDNTMTIAIARPKVLKEHGIYPKHLKTVYEGALIHENLHVTLLPFIPRTREVMSLLVYYIWKTGVPYNSHLLHEVSNVVADIMNETLYILYSGGGERVAKLAYTRVLYAKPPSGSIYDLEVNDPLAALFRMHHEFAWSIITGKTFTCTGRFCKKSEIIHEIIRNAIPEPVRDVILLLKKYNLTGGLSQLLAFIHDSGIEDLLLDTYDIIGRQTPLLSRDDETLQRVWKKVKDYGYKVRETVPLIVYYALTYGYYRFYVEKGFDRLTFRIPADIPAETISIDDAKKTVAVLEGMNSKELFLDGDTLERIASNLLSESLRTRERKSFVEVVTGRRTVPFLKHPRGRLDLNSIARSRFGPLEWKVYVDTEESIPVTVSASGSAPSHFTLAIDVSCSTIAPTSILVKYLGRDSTVLDAERAVALALAKRTLEAGGENTRSTLVVFSDEIDIRDMKLPELIETLKNVRKLLTVEMEGTEIIEAVREALNRHRDQKRNPFILLTDLALPESTIEELYMLLKSIRRSPVLVLVIGSSRLGVLEKLNNSRRYAVVGVETLYDISKIENAIRKISEAMS